jgi:Tfp pilus assembly protein PilE
VIVIIGILAAIAIPNYLGQQEEARDPAVMAQLQLIAYRYELKTRFSRMDFPRTTVGDLLCRDWHSSTHFANMPRGPRANLEGEPSALAADHPPGAIDNQALKADRYSQAMRPLVPNISLTRRPSRCPR